MPKKGIKRKSSCKPLNRKRVEVLNTRDDLLAEQAMFFENLNTCVKKNKGNKQKQLLIQCFRNQPQAIFYLSKDLCYPLMYLLKHHTKIPQDTLIELGNSFTWPWKYVDNKKNNILHWIIETKKHKMLEWISKDISTMKILTTEKNDLEEYPSDIAYFENTKIGLSYWKYWDKYYTSPTKISSETNSSILGDLFLNCKIQSKIVDSEKIILQILKDNPSLTGEELLLDIEFNEIYIEEYLLNQPHLINFCLKFGIGVEIIFPRYYLSRKEGCDDIVNIDCFYIYYQWKPTKWKKYQDIIPEDKIMCLLIKLRNFNEIYTYLADLNWETVNLEDNHIIKLLTIISSDSPQFHSLLTSCHSNMLNVKLNINEFFPIESVHPVISLLKNNKLTLPLLQLYLEKSKLNIWEMYNNEIQILEALCINSQPYIFKEEVFNILTQLPDANKKIYYYRSDVNTNILNWLNFTDILQDTNPTRLKFIWHIIHWGAKNNRIKCNDLAKIFYNFYFSAPEYCQLMIQEKLDINFQYSVSPGEDKVSLLQDLIDWKEDKFLSLIVQHINLPPYLKMLVHAYFWEKTEIHRILEDNKSNLLLLDYILSSCKSELILQIATPYLKNELHQLRETKKKILVKSCKVCLEEESDFYILNCGHGLFCRDCVETFNRTCPACKGYATKIKLFI